MKKLLILSALIFLYVFLNAYSYVSAISDNLYNSVFRLHVIANSDSEEDQNLKYIVRDNILNYINEQNKNFSCKEDLIIYMQNHIDYFKEIANKTVQEQGYDYPVTVEIGNFEFPTKTYGDIKFPAGFYDALRVKIGNANGQNWWCVMFPPLCFVDTTTGIVPEESKEALEENLSEENYTLISDTENSSISFKFKIVELFEKARLITAKTN